MFTCATDVVLFYKLGENKVCTAELPERYLAEFLIPPNIHSYTTLTVLFPALTIYNPCTLKEISASLLVAMP